MVYSKGIRNGRFERGEGADRVMALLLCCCYFVLCALIAALKDSRHVMSIRLHMASGFCGYSRLQLKDDEAG